MIQELIHLFELREADTDEHEHDGPNQKPKKYQGV